MDYKMNIEEFVNILKDHSDQSGGKKPVMMSITPSRGWKYILVSPVTDILPDEDGVAFISNAFSNESKKDSQNIKCIDDIIEILDDNSISQNHVAFEVYGVNRENINNQVVITYINDPDDISITEEETVVYIDIKTTDIATLS